ncbi:MAG: MerR family DNA-binding protein [Steroidobacteraceae bacterium]
MRFIKHAQQSGFTLDELQALLGLSGRPACKASRTLAAKKLVAIEEKMRMLTRHRKKPIGAQARVSLWLLGYIDICAGHRAASISLRRALREQPASRIMAMSARPLSRETSRYGARQDGASLLVTRCRGRLSTRNGLDRHQVVPPLRRSLVTAQRRFIPNRQLTQEGRPHVLWF